MDASASITSSKVIGRMEKISQFSVQYTMASIGWSDWIFSKIRSYISFIVAGIVESVWLISHSEWQECN